MSITAAEARQVVDAAVAKSEELGVVVTITVVDAAGEISAIGRQDGSGPVNFDLSYGLAYTSVVFGGAPGERLAGIADRNWFRAASIMRGGRLMAAKGALPVRRGDEVVGAIGVSGAPEDDDLTIAEAGAAALG